MSTVLSGVLFVAGLGLVIFFAEKLVKGAVGTSLGFGVSAFLVSVIFIGFDPENLAVGAVASYEEAAGIALGSIMGAAMVAIALAFGITALVAPMRFEQAPRTVLAIPVLAVVLLGVLSADNQLSRGDGVILLTAFAASLVFLLAMSKRGLDITAAGEVAESLEKDDETGKWKSLGLLLISLVAIIVGSELLVAGSGTLISALGLSETVFGMTVLALLVSVEELARELPAALKGRPEISYGNVAGSILAFFLFNAGIISLVRDVPVSPRVLNFYFPFCLVTVIIVSVFMASRRIPRWAGVVFIALYVVFFAGGYLS